MLILHHITGFLIFSGIDLKIVSGSQWSCQNGRNVIPEKRLRKHFAGLIVRQNFEVVHHLYIYLWQLRLNISIENCCNLSVFLAETFFKTCPSFQIFIRFGGMTDFKVEAFVHLFYFQTSSTFIHRNQYLCIFHTQYARFFIKTGATCEISM